MVNQEKKCKKVTIVGGGPVSLKIKFINWNMLYKTSF